MESKDELKETAIESRTCYYFDDIMKNWDRDIDIDFSSILLDETSYKKIRKYFNLWNFIQNLNECKTIA